MLYYHPFVYHWESGVEQELVQMAPNLLSVAQGEHVRVPPWSHSLQLVSSAGTSFTSFAKASQFGLGLLLSLSFPLSASLSKLRCDIVSPRGNEDI